MKIAAIIAAILFVMWQPKQGVAKSERAAGTKQSAKPAQDSYDAERDAIERLILQIQAQQEQESEQHQDAANQARRDAGIQGKLVNYTSALVWVGVVQAGILFLTVGVIYLQVRTTRNIERAWIFVSIGQLPPFTSDPAHIAFMWIKPTIQNYGRTPARITKIVARWQTMPMSSFLPQALPTEPEYPADQTSTIEGKDILLPPAIPSQPISVAVTPEQLTAAHKGEIALYIHGFITYLDTVVTMERPAPIRSSVGYAVNWSSNAEPHAKGAGR